MDVLAWVAACFVIYTVGLAFTRWVYFKALARGWMPDPFIRYNDGDIMSINPLIGLLFILWPIGWLLGPLIWTFSGFRAATEEALKERKERAALRAREIELAAARRQMEEANLHDLPRPSVARTQSEDLPLVSRRSA